MERIGIQFVVESLDLTEAQALHVREIGTDFCREMAEKYEKGQKEHGGNLFDMSFSKLLDHAIDEAIDQVVYLTTMRRQLRERANLATYDRGWVPPVTGPGDYR